MPNLCDEIRERCEHYDLSADPNVWKIAAELRAILARHEREEGLLIEIADCLYCNLCQDHFIEAHKRKPVRPALTPATPAEPPDLADETLPLTPTSQYKLEA
jgi:hypothetical protein